MKDSAEALKIITDLSERMCEAEEDDVACHDYYDEIGLKAPEKAIGRHCLVHRARRYLATKKRSRNAKGKR